MLRSLILDVFALGGTTAKHPIRERLGLNVAKRIVLFRWSSQPYTRFRNLPALSNFFIRVYPPNPRSSTF
jgi:hypothetical protein